MPHNSKEVKIPVREKSVSSTTAVQDDGHPHPQHPNYSTVLHYLDETVHHLAFSKIKPHHFYPRFDVEESETQYELFGELPGCRKEDIRIHDVHGYGVEIEGTTVRFPHREDEAQVGTQKQEGVEAPAGNKTAWPDMAEPGMSAAAEGGAAMSEAQDSTTSKQSELTTRVPPASSGPPAAHLAKSDSTNNARHGSQVGLMKELPVAYPRTLFHERLVGNFRRTVRFPEPVDTTKVEADLKDGILRVRVPKDLPKIAELENEKKKIEVAWADASLWGL